MDNKLPAPELGDRFRELFEASPDAIFEIDRDGLICLASEEAEKLFGYTREELIGKSIDDLVPARFRGQHAGHRARYEAAPRRRPMGSGLDLWALRKDGGEFPVDIKLGSAGGGQNLRVMCVIRDISERRLAESQIRELNQKLEQRNREVERANQMKSEFLASMSHELRTPLNTIIGFADLLKEQNAGDLNPKQMRYMDHIANGSRHLLSLINDILDLSKIEAGRMELRTEIFPAAEAIEEGLAAIRPSVDQKKLHLESNTGSAPAISADRQHFRQILFNLLSNAVKFTPPGGTIRVTTSALQNACRVCVADTGIGIAPEETESIFASFHQAAATTKGIKEGTGLGLAITRRLVEMNYGRIWVESQPGKGSQFYIELPLAERAPAVRDFSAQDGGVQREAPLVLIVEDEEPARELLTWYLESSGFQTAWCASGREAVRQAAELLPDAITLDLLLPDGNGLNTLRELKKDTATAAIPVVVVSVLDDRGIAMTLGAAEYLTKPVEKEALAAALRRHIPFAASGAGVVLVVEDDMETRYLLAEMLEAERYVSLLAANGEEAFEILSRTRPHVVILDLMMPVMNGFEMLAKLRADRLLQGLPVLVLTAKQLTNEDLRRLAGTTTGLLIKGEGWKDSLLAQLRGITQRQEKTLQ
jgi:PAS domain S-box-containing protein